MSASMSEFEEAHFEEARVFMSSDLGIPLEVIDEIDSRLILCTDLLDVYELGLFTPVELYECVNDEAWIDDNIQYLEFLVVYSGYVQDKLLRGEAVTEEALRGFSHKDYGRFKQRSAANRFRLAMKKARLEYLQAKDELLRIEAEIATVNQSIASKSGSQASIGPNTSEKGIYDDGDDGSIKPKVIQLDSNSEMIDSSVARKHQVTPNVYGTQTFYLSEKGIIGLATKSCLQTFAIKIVQDGDVDKYPTIIDITLSSDWNPNDHQDKLTDTIQLIGGSEFVDYSGELLAPKTAAAASAKVDGGTDPPGIDIHGFKVAINDAQTRNETRLYYFDASDAICDRNVIGEKSR